jgi:type IV secretory pathway protease TraF
MADCQSGPGTLAQGQVAAHPGTNRRRPRVWSLASAAGAALLATHLWHPRPLLVWNATPSSAEGLYSVAPARRLRAGDIVIAWAPDPARRLAAQRHYLPLNVPLVKSIAAVAPHHVCASEKRILVDGRPVAIRARRDRSGRLMPWWTGCELLRGGDLLLLGRGGPRAFDGRYFGVTRGRQVIGRARLLWPA